ncbi:intersectin-1 [Contarinia nasturtii]|uniref:intersectin-1 n=1 Tax=Contarinia nasturtii TaxID=265458 RepID=UPI0012D37A1E|nr:intersectin-1 [Contarinia nasturtii]
MSAAVDPFVITSRERAKYIEQFKSLKPVNEVVTGQQARGFFLQSQLPPAILGEIWALADTDRDGKMNIDEFSIACKLVNLKLRGFEMPKQLPPTMIASLKAVGSTPTLTPTGSLSPVNVPARPVLPPQLQKPAQQTPNQQNQPIPLISNIGIGLNIATQEATQPQMMNIQPVPIIPNVQQPIIPIQPSLIMQVQPTTTNGALLIDSLINDVPAVTAVNTAVAPVISNPIPAPPTPPSGTQSRSMSVSEKVPSIESPGSATSAPVIEWAIKNKLKYTQLFNTTDRTRNGYLTGVQARNLLLQSKLPQASLAQIWALSDIDSDGRLSCDEFVLAMHLCEIASQGEPIPAKLPLELVPPSFRKSTSRHGSVSASGSNSRHGSISSQSGSVANADLDALHNYNQTTFEDKRKENFDKGQAELERRRKILQDAQRKEIEERERKERDEADKKEKARIAAERKEREELERQIQIQRELEEEREEKRKRELEQKEAARKEMEKQRQIEWENQQLQKMQQSRQQEQEKLLKLKAQNQTYTIELGSLNDKVKELSQKICDTRVSVTSVKTVIDGMRSTRDTQMSEMTALKSRIKEQNAKLVHLSQEKAKLDSKNAKGDGLSQEIFANKQMNINQLRGKLQNLKEEIEPKESDVNANTEQLNDVKTKLKTLLDDCEDIYALYVTHRNQVNELKNNKKNDSLTSAWDSAATVPQSVDSWSTSVVASVAATTNEITTKPGYAAYRAIYEFDARNSDEITFQPGDIIMVPFEQNAEPGWLAGEINGHTGWFPESYVEKIAEEEVEATSENVSNFIVDENQSAVQSENAFNTNTKSEYDETYISCYPYESTEPGDLTFDGGEYIVVTKKDGDWWTGTIGNRTGIFPSNYVQNATSNEQTNTDSSPYYTQEVTSTQNYSDDVSNQEEADTEVSEINTQPKTDTVQDNYSRPMSTSSTTSGIRGSKKGEVAQVIAPYESTSSEQLSLQRGQYIMIRKKSETGWWEGELQARGRRKQIGWFPATYVKVLQSGRLSGRSTPVSGGKIQMNETILDKMIALYPYKAQNDDELSFEKDDIISVLGRDEPEWWRGECQGLTGLFPSNYVGPFVSSGNV